MMVYKCVTLAFMVVNTISMELLVLLAYLKANANVLQWWKYQCISGSVCLFSCLIYYSSVNWFMLQNENECLHNRPACVWWDDWALSLGIKFQKIKILKKINQEKEKERKKPALKIYVWNTFKISKIDVNCRYCSQP